MTLFELLNYLRGKLLFLIVIPVLCTLAVAAYVWMFVPNSYSSTGIMNVKSNAPALASLLESDGAQVTAADNAGISNISDYKIQATAGSSSLIMLVTVTGPSAQGAADLANALMATANETAVTAIGKDVVSIAEKAQPPTSPSGLQRKDYVFIAAAFSFLAVWLCLYMRLVRFYSAGHLCQIARPYLFQAAARRAQWQDF